MLPAMVGPPRSAMIEPAKKQVYPVPEIHEAASLAREVVAGLAMSDPSVSDEFCRLLVAYAKEDTEIRSPPSRCTCTSSSAVTPTSSPASTASCDNLFASFNSFR